MRRCWCDSAPALDCMGYGLCLHWRFVFWAFAHCMHVFGFFPFLPVSCSFFLISFLVFVLLSFLILEIPYTPFPFLSSSRVSFKAPFAS